MSNLLINEPPLQVLPTLARLIGLNEAVALQQLHYEMHRSPHVKRGADGALRRWVGYTQAEWHQEVFKHIWSKRTIQRIFEALVSAQLVLVEQFGQKRGDRTNWYTIDYEALESLVPPTHEDNLAPCPPGAPSKPVQPELFDGAHDDNLASSTSRQVGTMPIVPTWPLQEDANLSSSSSKREINKNNNNTPARETEVADSPNGVVVVLSEDLPTPRTEAYRLLKKYGVTEKTILSIIRAHSDAEIERQVAHLDFERSQGKPIQNPGGRLAKMIRDQWALPPGAEAVYRRRFLAGDVAGETGPPAPAVESRVDMEPDAFDLQLAALPEDQRAALRQHAEQLAQDQNSDLGGPRLEHQVQLHMRRLLPLPSRSANDSQHAS